MIHKNHRHRGRGVKVTFAVPVEWVDRGVSVVGEFNAWDASATPLRKRGGMRTASVVLEPGRTYAFRYVDEWGRWFDDPAADAQIPNEFGGLDGVIDLR